MSQIGKAHEGYEQTVAWCSCSSGMLATDFSKRAIKLSIHTGVKELHSSSTFFRSVAYKGLMSFPQGSGSPMVSK